MRESLKKCFPLSDVPNGGRGTKTADYPKGYPPKVINGERQEFDGFFRDYIKELETKKAVIVTGDLNVAHEAIGKQNNFLSSFRLL